MSLTVALTPELQSALEAAAAARGLEASAFAAKLIGDAPVLKQLAHMKPFNRQEFEAVLDLMAANSDLIPDLPDEAFPARACIRSAARDGFPAWPR